LVWEAGHFKPATITTTIFRIGWHRSKGLELHTLNSRVVAQMPQAIRVFQGAKRVLFRQTRLSSPYPFFLKVFGGHVGAENPAAQHGGPLYYRSSMASNRSLWIVGK